MANWKDQIATIKQVAAIKTYEDFYEITIGYKNKQDAHDVISSFCKYRELHLHNGIIGNTSVSYVKDSNKTLPDGLYRIRLDKPTSANNHLLAISSINDNVHKLLTEPSYSDYEDSLGYLDEKSLERESQIYGVDPILNGKL